MLRIEIIVTVKYLLPQGSDLEIRNNGLVYVEKTSPSLS